MSENLPEKKEKIKTTCPRCSYSWECKSLMMYVSCPSCQIKVKLRDKYGSEKNG
jgi:endogenous inhibitor of DNA gyrase (YacG/DUF329 family)